ncbi:hypothetical protein SAMN05421642_103347 [Rhodococcoides kyotonense]|uniref:Uncharacterized protein n=1 Tax=Rhodococcoides kyotonense TaxID=398843 RepID=A0A239FMQ7_9NOCA|nr:hypothetical protein SAMN05421642_103347 [Rhodococcus kyotonensis]
MPSASRTDHLTAGHTQWIVTLIPWFVADGAHPATHADNLA